MVRQAAVLFTFFAIFLAGGIAKADFKRIPVCTDANGQSEPDVWGDCIVWTNKYYNEDVHGYYISTGQKFVICAESGDQDQPRLSSGLVVWRDKRDGTYKIYAAQPPFSGSQRVSSFTSDQQTPAISGSNIVWRDKRLNTYGNIFYTDQLGELGTGICTGTTYQYQPDIDGNRVVWADKRGGKSDNDIYTAFIDGSGERALCSDANDQTNPRISGNIVVWQEATATDGGDIYGYDLANDIKFPICVREGTQAFPVIDGNLVAWEDDRNADPNGYDIYGYDLLNHIELEICTDWGNQQKPAVSGDIVVWQHERIESDTYSGDIYMAYRPVPLTITVTQPRNGDVLMAGKTEQITWQNTGNIENVKLEYYNDPNWVEIITSIDNSWAYEWDVPAVDANHCKIRVSDATNPAVYGESDVFTVFVCDPNLTADINRDCFVDFLDFADFSAQWLDCGNRKNPAWCGQ